MTLFDSIARLVDAFVGVSKLSMLNVREWTRGGSTESERDIESGQKQSDDWQDDFPLLFDDFVETII
ncbi:hypothetical protein PSPO01_05478 [Paraphaeosphaeria sporulosa]